MTHQDGKCFLLALRFCLQAHVPPSYQRSQIIQPCYGHGSVFADENDALTLPLIKGSFAEAL